MSLLLRPSVCNKCARRLRLSSMRWNSTGTAPDPPLLGTMRSDLKAAMRAKDKTKLNVLRAIISEANNASKTSSPIRDNMQMLSIIRKRRAASKTAAAEALEAKREDLSRKQEDEIAVLDEYASQVPVMSYEDTERAVDTVLEALKTDGTKLTAGAVLKELLKGGGPLEGKMVDKSLVAKLVQSRLKETA